MKKALYLFIIISLAVVGCSETPDTTVKNGNEGFVIGNGSVAVVLTHGLGGSPFEVKALAEYLAARNITVYAVRLAGHGTSVEDSAQHNADEWYKNVHEAYRSVKPLKETVFIGGMSLGGVLALKVAEEEDTAGVIALAPALILDDARSNYAWLYKYTVPYSNRNISRALQPYYYSKFSVASVAEAVSIANDVQNNLGAITEPTFLMQYDSDYRVSPKSSQIVYDSISSTDKTLQWINGTGHVMILAENDANAEQYFEAIYQFIVSHS